MEDNPSGTPDDHSHHHSAKPHHGSYGHSGKVIEPAFPDPDEAGDATPIQPAHIEVPQQYVPSPVPFAPPASTAPVPFTPLGAAPLPPPPPAPPATPHEPTMQVEADPDHPLAVAQVYSTYGIEYILMFISLAAAAISFASLLNGIIDLTMSKSSGLALVSSVLDPYAEAALIVSFPIFAFLFLRLESKEDAEPSLLTDASRRRSMQIALFVSFVVGLGGLAGYIGGLLSKASPASSYYGSGSGSGSSGFATFLHALIDLSIAGAIFGYYWYKLHKKSGQNWQ